MYAENQNTGREEEINEREKYYKNKKMIQIKILMVAGFIKQHGFLHRRLVAGFIKTRWRFL